MSSPPVTEADPGVPDEDWRPEERPSATGGRILRGLGWTGGAHVISQGTWFGSLVLLATLLPPDSFGIFAAAMVIVSIAQLMVTSAAGNLIVDKEVGPEQLRASLAVTFGVGLLSFVLVAVAAGPLVGLFGTGAEEGVLRGLVGALAIQATSVVPLALLRRHLRFKPVAVATGGSALAGSAVAVVAALLGAGVWALVLRQIIIAGVLTAVGWWTARDLFPPLRRLVGRVTLQRAASAGGAWFVYLGIMNLIAINLDYVVIGRALTSTELGLYSLAFTLGFAPLTQFSWIIGSVLLSSTAAMGSPQEVGVKTLGILRVGALVLFPLMPLVVVIAPWAIPNVLGERWEGMVLPFQILFCVGVVQGLVNILGDTLAGSGHIVFHCVMKTVWAAVMVPLLLILVASDGIRGASFAHLIALVPVTLGYLIWGARRLELSPGRVLGSMRDVALPVAAQALTTLALALGLAGAGVGSLLTAAAAAIGGTAVLLALLAVAPSKPLGQVLGVLSASRGG